MCMCVIALPTTLLWELKALPALIVEWTKKFQKEKIEYDTVVSKPNYF